MMRGRTDTSSKSLIRMFGPRGKASALAKSTVTVGLQNCHRWDDCPIRQANFIVRKHFTLGGYRPL
jgi:hypothetical protein